MFFTACFFRRTGIAGGLTLVAILGNYGWSSDVGDDSARWGAAAINAMIAIGAISMPVAVTRVWRKGHRLAATTLGVIAAGVLLTNFSTGTSFVGARTVQADAHAQVIIDRRKDIEREIEWRRSKRDNMRFWPTTEAIVAAKKEEVATAEQRAKDECGSGVGTACKARRAEVATAKAGHSRAQEALAMTREGTRLSGEIVALRKQLEETKIPVKPTEHGQVLLSILQTIGLPVSDAASAVEVQGSAKAAAAELVIATFLVIAELLGKREGEQKPSLWRRFKASLARFRVWIFWPITAPIAWLVRVEISPAKALAFAMDRDARATEVQDAMPLRGSATKPRPKLESPNSSLRKK